MGNLAICQCTQVFPREGTYPKTLSHFFNLKSTIHFGVKGRIAPEVIWKLLGSAWNCWWIRSGCFGNYSSTLTTMLVTIAADAGCLLHHQKKRYHLVPYYAIALPFCAIPYPCDGPGLCYACLPCGLNGELLVRVPMIRDLIFTNLPLTENFPRNHHFG